MNTSVGLSTRRAISKNRTSLSYVYLQNMYIQRLAPGNVYLLTARVRDLGYILTFQVKMMPIPHTDTRGAKCTFRGIGIIFAS